MSRQDHDAYWAQRMSMTPDQQRQMREKAEESVRQSYDAATRVIARGGEAAERLVGQAGVAIDKFKAGVQSELDRRLGGGQPSTARTPIGAPARAAQPSALPDVRHARALDDGAGELMSFVAKGEGTLRNGDGYNETIGYGKYVPPGTKLTDMTLDEIMDLQRQMRDGGSPSSALGRYQFTRATLDDFGKRRLKLTGQEKFTPELQDRIVREILFDEGYDKFLAGDITASEFQKNMAGRWNSWAYDAGDLTAPSRRVPPRRANVTTNEIGGVIGKLKADYDRSIQQMLDEGRLPPAGGGWR